MDAEAAGGQTTKPWTASCGGPVMKALMVGSLMGSAGLMGLMLGLHFSGNLTSSPASSKGPASEQHGSQALSQEGPLMVSAANKVSKAGGQGGQGVDTALVATAVASSDAAGDLSDAITDLAGDVQDMLDKVAEAGDSSPMNDGSPDPSDSLSDSLEADGGGGGDSLEGDGVGDSSMEDGMGDGGETDPFGDLSDSAEDLFSGPGESLGDAGEALGDLGESFGESSESLEDGLGGGGRVAFGDGLGDISDSFEDGLGGDGPVLFGDGMDDLGMGFGDLDDSLGAGMMMSSFFNNNNNHHHARRSRQNAQRPSRGRNLNPLGFLLMAGD